MEITTVIKDALRDLLSTTPYGKVTIEDICAKANVSKKTLYARFDGKRSIMSAIYYDDFILPPREIRNHLPVDRIESMSVLMLEQSFEMVLRNRTIYENYIQYCGRDAFASLCIENAKDLNKEVYALRGLKGSELEYVSFYVAAANAMIVARWLEGGCVESPAEMAALCKKWIFCRFSYLD